MWEDMQDINTKLEVKNKKEQLHLFLNSSSSDPKRKLSLFCVAQLHGLLY